MRGRAIKKISFVPGPEVIVQPMTKFEGWPFWYTVRPASCAKKNSSSYLFFNQENKKRLQAVDEYGPLEGFSQESCSDFV